MLAAPVCGQRGLGRLAAILPRFGNGRWPTSSGGGEAMIVADSITIFVGSAVRTRWAAKPSVYNRLPHVPRTWGPSRARSSSGPGKPRRSARNGLPMSPSWGAGPTSRPAWQPGTAPAEKPGEQGGGVRGPGGCRGGAGDSEDDRIMPKDKWRSTRLRVILPGSASLTRQARGGSRPWRPNRRTHRVYSGRCDWSVGLERQPLDRNGQVSEIVR